MKISMPERFNTTRAKEILVLSLIILLAIGVRVGITYNTLGVPTYSGMTAGIGETARNLAKGRGYVISGVWGTSISEIQQEKGMLIDLEDVPLPRPETPEDLMPYYGLPPGPSVMLAGTYLLFGEYRYVYWRLLNGIISSFGCLLIFLLGKELFNRRTGLIAAVIYALYLPLAYLSTWALHDALTPFFALLALYLFVMGVRRKAISFYLLTGLVIGVSCYFQPTMLLLPLAFAAGLFFYNIGSGFKKNSVEVLKVTLVMMVVLVAVLSPWVIRNYHITGNMILMRPSMWQGIWEGFGEYENPVGAVHNDEITYKQVTEEWGYQVQYGTPEYDAVLRGKVLDAVTQYPVWWLETLGRRVPRTIFYSGALGINDYPRNEAGDILWEQVNKGYPGFKPLIRDGRLIETLKNQPHATFTYGLQLIRVYFLFMFIPPLLSILGIWLMRRRWREISLFIPVFVYFSAICMLFFIEAKLLLAGSLVYILLIAVVVDYVVSRVKEYKSAKQKSEANILIR